MVQPSPTGFADVYRRYQGRGREVTGIFFEVRNLVKYFGVLTAVDDISFKVGRGEIFGLIGPNGSGKTTVFNLISNYTPVSSGSIHFKGRDITGMKTHRISRMGIARTFQVVNPIKGMTVLENVMAAAFSAADSRREAMKSALKTLEFCDLLHRKEVLAQNLPIGERKRLEIGRSLATRPRLLLLDEMSSGLNPGELESAIDLIGRIRETGVSIIIVEHVMKVIMTLSDRIHVLNLGRTLMEGTPGEVTGNPAVIKAYLGGANADD